MNYNLVVKDFGKIKEANIKVSPLTFIVGDNNSGKSYLLSLLWAMKNINRSSPLFKDLENINCTEYKNLYNKVAKILTESKTRDLLKVNIKELTCIVNALFSSNKDDFIKRLFNSEKVHIGELKIELDNDINYDIEIATSTVFSSEENRKIVRFSNIEKKFRIGLYLLNDDMIDDDYDERIEFIVINLILNMIFSKNRHRRNVYLPAARTGFVLAKNAINKSSRRIAFDMMSFDEYKENGIGERENEPFTKPILSFLEELEETQEYFKEKYEEGKLIPWIEMNMAKGRVSFKDEQQKEILYTPNGSEESLPLRVTSAVVTELTPLILLLKYGDKITSIFYEEPEMCLHPQLQLKMAMLLIRLVNFGIPIIATTHSDIIMQHVNNMCKLSQYSNRESLMQNHELTEEDLITKDKVSVYQLRDEGRTTFVEKLEATDDGFKVSTFTDALLKIFNKSSEIYELEFEQEE